MTKIFTFSSFIKNIIYSIKKNLLISQNENKMMKLRNQKKKHLTHEESFKWPFNVADESISGFK